MTDPGDLRPNEEAVELEPASDASLRFIGTIRTPWRDRKDCPRQGKLDGPECQLVLHPIWHSALQGLEDYDTIEVLYWLDQSRRDLVRQSPRRLAGSAQPDRHLHGQTGSRRKRNAGCSRPGLSGRNATTGYQTGPVRLQPEGTG